MMKKTYTLIFVTIIFATSFWGQSKIFDANKLLHSSSEKDTFRYEFPWLKSFKTENTLINRIPVPYGFKRLSHPEISFAHWLQRLPLKEGNP